tara:strand:- start:1023 stop:2486 length:1464 start_codon:yes stop_codon:yes gene_type:complete
MKLINIFNKKFLKIRSLNFLFKNSNNGFTLSELVVSSSISIGILLSAYYFINIISQLNKNDSSQIKLFSRLESALDFIIDEINSGQEIIVDKNKINPLCELPKGDFIFALDFPKQFIREDLNDFDNNYLNQENFTTLDCPIIYSLDLNKNINKESYKLMRTGPSIDSKGFYTAEKYKKTIITDKISNKIYDIELICLSTNWQKIQVKGIELCVDDFKRTAEISITVNDDSYKSGEKYITKTSAALNRIDKNILMRSNLDIYDENIQNNGSLCLRGPCNFGPISLTGGINNKSIVFILDVSGSMRNRSRSRSSRIQGFTRLQKAQIDLVNSIFNLKKDIKFQVISFGVMEQLLFEEGPQTASFFNKRKAYRWIFTRRADQEATLPSSAIMNSLSNQDIGQIIIISDGQITKEESCPFQSESYTLDECATQYNEIVRSNQDLGNNKFIDNRVTIDSLSIGENYCNTFSDSNNWMGKIAKKNGGRCSVLR